MRDCLLRHFSKDELAEKGYMQRPLDRDMRTSLGKMDLEFFSAFYLPHHFYNPFAWFHRLLFQDIEDLILSYGQRRLLEIVFRGGGKSTIDTLATPLWAICYTLRHYITMISDSESQAKEKLATLKTELETNPRLLEDFGDLRGEKWQEIDIETKNQVKIRALGQGMAFRGRKYLQWRPDLIILDDIEDDEGVRSETQRHFLEQWLIKTILKALDAQDGKLLVVGNFIHYECLLLSLRDNPQYKHRVFSAVMPDGHGDFKWATRAELWDQWHDIITDLSNPNRIEDARAFYEERKEEMLEGAEVAWPEQFPYYNLMLQRLDGPSEFACEMLNVPIDPTQRFFGRYGTFRLLYDREAKETALVPWNHETRMPAGRPAVLLSDCTFFAATDPSLGETKRSDPSALVIAAKGPNNQLFVLEADIMRRSPDQIIKDQIKWYSKFPDIVRWGVESVQFQKFFMTISAREALTSGNKIPFIEIAVHNQQKAMRIESLQGDLSNHYILINEDGCEELKKQIEQYPMGAKVDGLDALEMVRTLADEFQPDASAAVQVVTTHRFGDGFEKAAKGTIWDAGDIWSVAEAAAEEADKQREAQKRDKQPVFHFPISL
jgi:predicted phage terminase large subunit-like protein